MTLEKVARRLSVNLRKCRRKFGYTQAQLANEAGVTAETVARIERVVRARQSANLNPSLGTLCQLADALAIDVVDLLAKRGNNG